MQNKYDLKNSQNENSNCDTDSKESAINKTAPTTLSIGSFRTKIIKDLVASRTSTNKEDFIEVLNSISPEFGGVTNLGVFCDILSIEQSSALLSDVEEQFIHVDTVRDEQPYNRLVNDGSSVNPFDFDYHLLLNN